MHRARQDRNLISIDQDHCGIATLNATVFSALGRWFLCWMSLHMVRARMGIFVRFGWLRKRGRRRNLECLNNVHVYIMMASGGVTRTQSQAELTPARVGLLLVYPHFHALVLYWWTSHCHARASWWLGEVTTYLVNQHSSNNLHHESVKLHWEMYTCTFYASMHLVRTMLQKLFFRAAIMTPRSFNVELNVY